MAFPKNTVEAALKLLGLDMSEVVSITMRRGTVQVTVLDRDSDGRPTGEFHYHNHRITNN